MNAKTSLYLFRLFSAATTAASSMWIGERRGPRTLSMKLKRKVKRRLIYLRPTTIVRRLRHRIRNVPLPISASRAKMEMREKVISMTSPDVGKCFLVHCPGYLLGYESFFAGHASVDPDRIGANDHFHCPL